MIILLGKHLFHKWFNNISLLSFIWFILLFLYEAKLLPYHNLKSLTWFYIICFFLIFLAGVLTIFAARKSLGLDNDILNKGSNTLMIFQDEGKTLRTAIIITGLIGLVNAIQSWIVLLNMYGGFAQVFLSANEIYRMRINSKIEGFIPYLQVFSIIGIFLSGMYSAYKNKISIIAFIPILAYTLKSLALFARIGMLIALVCFLTSYILTKIYLNKRQSVISRFSFKNVLVILIVVLFIMLTSSLVKSFRGTYERYKGSSPVLTQLSDNILFSPSVYLYMSSHIGVFNEYLEKGTEKTRFAETTFSSVYNLLAKFELTERAAFDKPGYFIPMWTNSGTFLRDLHGDYGEVGMFIFIYVLGLLSTYYWFLFFIAGKLTSLVMLVYSMIIIQMSFFSLVLQGADILLSLIFLLFLLPLLEKFVKKRQSLTVNG